MSILTSRALKNLGHELGRNTIKRLLAEHGIAPAPERGRSMSWSTFIKAHWGAIAATDLLFLSTRPGPLRSSEMAHLKLLILKERT